MKNKITLILTSLILFVIYLSTTSSSGGINGVAVSGCTCHGVASTNTVVTVTGLPVGGYANSGIYSLTISVTNTTFTGAAGFDMTATSGAFTAVTGTALNGATEIRHNAPKTRVSGTASWTFNWTAPATGSANVTFAVSGNAVNLNGNTSGDQWNQISTTIYKSGAVLAVTATSTPAAIACNGGVATITATGVGPTVPYMYSRNGGTYQSSGSFTNNLAGIYTITVRDAALMTASTTLTITQPTLVVIGGVSATPINCNAGTSTITLTAATGGTGAFTYRINAGTYTNTLVFNNNLAGTYTVTARDAALCTKTTTIIITQPTAMVFSVPAITPPPCNGGTGSVTTAITSGGTGSKTYTINPLGPQSNATGTFTGLTAQGYTVTATDANNCTKTTLITISQPAILNFGTPFITAPLCFGGIGSAAITATGGVGTRTFSISPLGPQTNTSGAFTGLSAQAYTVTVTDANLCTKTTIITISQPSVLIFSPPSISPPLCAGGLGSFVIAASGGTIGKVYSVMPGNLSSTNGLFLNLTPQTYTATVTDGAGCSLSTEVIIPNPSPITFSSPTVTNPLCNGGTGSASVLVSGGTGPYTYSWSNNIQLTTSKDNSIFEQNQNNSNGEGPHMYAGQLLNGFRNRALLQFDLSSIPTGSTFTAASLTLNCSNSAPGSGLQPMNLHALTEGWGEGSSNAGTPGGTGIAATANDATWISRIHPSTSWSTAGAAFSNTVSGTAAVDATDFYTWSSAGILNDLQSWLNNSANNYGWLLKGQESANTQAKRFDTKENPNASNRPQLNITYSLATNSATQNNLIAGTYTVIVTDANNCSLATSISLIEPPPVVATASNVIGCTGSPISLIGSPAGGSFSVPDPYTGPSTTYTYTYTDGNGCIGTSAPATITVDPCGSTVNLKLFLQGYYLGLSTMAATLFNEGVSANTTLTDSITVELRDANFPHSIIDSKVAELNIDGTATCSFNTTGSYYIAIQHRNTLATWSKLPVTLLPITNYDFSTANTQAYGDNLVEIETGIWALYTGDLNADDNTDLLDLSLVETDINIFAFGYLATDLNGDGNVDLLDSSVLETNINNFIFSAHP